MTRIVINIPDESFAAALCAELVKQGKTFRCEKKLSGWEFEVLPSAPAGIEERIRASEMWK